MKLSMFNNSVFHDGTQYIYNALSDGFLALDPTLFLLFDSLKSQAETDQLAILHPDFYQSLVKNKFLVSPEVDEIEEVKKISRIVDENEEHFTLIINPTMNCNFKCWYCYESHEKGSKMGKETVDNICKFVDNLIANNPKLKWLDVSWFGGEPLLYYKDVIAPIMDYIYAKCLTCGITIDFKFTTNGFLFTDEMIDNLTKFPISGFQITLDGNKDYHDTVRFVNSSRGSYDVIVGNIRKLANNNLRVGVRVNYTNQNLDNFESIFDDLMMIAPEKRPLVTVGFHKVWQEKESELTLNRVRMLVRQINDLGFVSHVGAVPDNVRHSCYADRINSATINYNGNVYKCTARNFSADAREGVLEQNGIIQWNQKALERRNIKFKNRPCLECPILPICNGGCSQHALENMGKDYCVYNFDKNQKNEVILDKLIARIA